MKRNLLFSAMLVAILIAFASPPGAEAQTTLALANGKTYANSQNDTSATFKVGQFNRVGLLVSTKDSAAADLYVDTRPIGSSTWTQKYADSVVTTTDAGTVKEIILRDATTERAPGVAVETRVRTAWRGSGNGVTSAKYSDVAYFR